MRQREELNGKMALIQLMKSFYSKFSVLAFSVKITVQRMKIFILQADAKIRDFFQYFFFYKKSLILTFREHYNKGIEEKATSFS